MQMNVLRTKQVSHMGNRDNHGQPIAGGDGQTARVCYSYPCTKTPSTENNLLRPISLLPVLGKILESFMVDWLCDFLAPTLDSNQFGGLKQRSTAHALVSILHSWCSTLDQGGSITPLFLPLWLVPTTQRLHHHLQITYSIPIMLRYGR